MLYVIKRNAAESTVVAGALSVIFASLGVLLLDALDRSPRFDKSFGHSALLRALDAWLGHGLFLVMVLAMGAWFLFGAVMLLVGGCILLWQSKPADTPEFGSDFVGFAEAVMLWVTCMLVAVVPVAAGLLFLGMLPLIIRRVLRLRACSKVTDERETRTMKLKTACLTLVMLVYGCGHDAGIQIRFVLPPGFEGFIILKRDVVDGVEPEWNEGTPFYRVPANGRLTVKSLAPFEAWHKLVCTSADGEQLHTDTDDDARMLPKGTPVLWELESSRDENQVERHVLYYGTMEAAAEAREKVIQLR